MRAEVTAHALVHRSGPGRRCTGSPRCRGSGFAPAVRAAKGGAVEFRVEKAGLIHAGVGKASFSEQALVENIRAFADAVMKAKPPGSKGTFLKRVAVASTMGPGVKIEPTSLVGGAVG